MKNNKFILLGLLCIIGQNSWAQQKNNYFDIVKQSDDYFKTSGTKNPDYKNYQRWKWYFSTRTALNGDLLNTTDYKQNALQQINWMTPNLTESNTGAWSFLGPDNVASTDEGIGRVNRITFHPTSAATLFASTAGGGLWKTTNSGASWFCLTNGLPNLNTSGMAIDYTNTNILYLLTGDGDGSGGSANGQFGYGRYSIGVLKSYDGGGTWVQTNLTFLETDNVDAYKIIMHPTNPNILFVATSSGIYKTTDGFNTFTRVRNLRTYDIEFRPNNASTVYATGDGYFFRSTNTGSTWGNGKYLSGNARCEIAVCPSLDTRVYILSGPSTAIGEFNGFFRYNNTDSSITDLANTPNILGSSSVGNDKKDQAWYDLALAVNPTTSAQINTGGIYSWRSTNSGSSFSYVNPNSSTPPSKYHADIHELAYNPLNNYLYMACDGGMYVSTDFGVTFDAINTNLAITQYYKISSSKTNATLILGGAQDNGTNKRTANNSSFTKVSGADGMDCTFGNSTNNIHFTSAQDGVIYRSGNAGSSFTTFTNPELTSIGLGHDSGYVVGQWCTPIALHPSNDNILFLGYEHVIKVTRNTSPFVYNVYEDISDRGTGYRNVSGKTFLKVGTSNANRIYAGDNEGYYTNSSEKWNAVYRTNDGGATWTSIRSEVRSAKPPVTDLAVNPGNSLDIWLTYGGYVSGKKVFHSSDGGDNWTDVTGTLPNVPVNCILYGDDASNTNDPIYIGTDIGVFYKDNSLGDWIPYHNGLPAVEVTDLELNFTDNLLRAGTYGRGMWETSLYSNCNADLTFSTSNQTYNLSYYHQASNTINSTAETFGNGVEVFYKAGVDIDLKEGFVASAFDNTSVFEAFIGNCGGGVPSIQNKQSSAAKTGYLINYKQAIKKAD
ncbi:MAG: 3-coathanger stack domain-containing protein [Ferruginibacter sp.]